MLSLMLDGGTWSASHCREGAPDSHWTGSLDVEVKKKIPACARNQTLVIQPIAQYDTD
jgi:hypothetical protein